MSTMKGCGDTNGYRSARTPDSATAKAVHQPGSDSQEGVWIHGERSATGMYPHPLLFNIYAENIMREDLEECESGISVGRRMVTDLIYAEDTTLLVGTKKDLTELVERVRRASEKAGLYINVGKTKVITYYRRHRRGDSRWLGYRGSKENLFLGALITKDGLCQKKVRRRIAMGKAAMGGQTSNWKDR